MNGRLLISIILSILIGVPIVIAQDDTCPEIVQTALANVEVQCGNTARNEACYGSLLLTAAAQPDVVDFAFDAPGDIVNVADIQSLTVSSMDEATGEWGISLMQLQASLPDTLPGQNVTVLLFGDVEIKPVQPPPEIEVTVGSGSNVNVRSGPSTGDSVVGALAAGTTVFANGKNAAGDWLRVRIPDGGLGWAFAELLSGDASILNVVSTDDAAFTPMQVFYFRSGIGDAPCAEAPDSGILIQTPKSVGQITLTVNEVRISLGSTVYLQAQPDDVMTISVLEGQVTVSAFDVTQTIPAGSQATVPIDENLAASGPPTTAEPYVEEDMQSLPVDVLPNNVESDTPESNTPVSESVSGSDPCIATASGAVNLRSGPGTAYTAAGSIAAGGSAAPTGQATGVDGYLWWQLANRNWVRSDVVSATGNCDGLPTVNDIPPTPTPAPVTSGGSSNSSRGSSGNVVTTVFLWNCSRSGSVTVAANQPFSLELGIGEWTTAAGVEYIQTVATHSISVNGTPATFSYATAPRGSGSRWDYGVFYTFGGLPPGEYVAVGRVQHPGGPLQINGSTGGGDNTATCTIVAQ